MGKIDEGDLEETEALAEIEEEDLAADEAGLVEALVQADLTEGQEESQLAMIDLLETIDQTEKEDSKTQIKGVF